jgi:hypothetical protein
VLLAGALLSVVGAAPAAAQMIGARPGSYGLHASDCLVPGVIAWYSGNALAGGMGYNPCPNPIPLPTVTTPAPTPEPVVTAPPPAAEEPPPVEADASPSPDPSSPVADVTPTPVYVPPPPPQRIPVAVPTYTPWIATNGPGSNAIGGGNGTASYTNFYNTLAPRARAAVSRTDWCNRDGRSEGATSACIKSAGGK